MQIGWVDFSKTERDKVVSILRLLGTQTALDELGIGTVRDAFSDMLFPGISTLQTRAKYFVILATVYKGNIIKNLIMDCQSYTKYRPNETTGGIFVSWRRKEELPTGA